MCAGGGPGSSGTSSHSSSSWRAIGWMIGHHRRMQPRPRVLAVAQSADPGGAELALKRLAERLPDHGFDVEIAQLPIGSVERGGWPRAVVSWPRAKRKARSADLVLLNGVATQRLAPAMTNAV